MALSHPHRPSALKQQNKKHQTLGHRSKGSVAKSNKGRISVKTLSKKAKKELSREQRKHRSKQIRAFKKEAAILRKRGLGTANNPPFLATVVPLCPNINPRKVLKTLAACDKAATITTSSQGIMHISCPRFRQRFSFVVPPVNDLYAVLDSVKKKHQSRQNLIKDIELRFPGPAKLYSLERDQDALMILRQIGAQKQRPLYFRDSRPHILAENVEFIEEGSSGTLKIHGYIRGKSLSVNGLVHIPGWGEYQMSRIDSSPDPHPLLLHSRDSEANVMDGGTFMLAESDPALQETLTSTNEVDPMEGEQTWPTEEELAEAEQSISSKPRTKRVPKGTSDYQAAWILESEEEEEEDDDDESRSNMDDGFAPVDNVSQDGYECEDDNEEEYEMTVTDAEGVNYDDKIDYGAEIDALQKLKNAREDAMFPDEVDTPMDMPASIRFQKFRGLQSFRTSPWDPNENLPVDYSRIFQFENFRHTKKRVMNEEKQGALPGWYVVVHIADVPRHLYDNHVSSHSPLAVFGLLIHEQKMSVINVVIKSHSLGHLRPIKSKERLIFHIGYRRFANAPIFSEHSTGNKHKLFRYFQPGSTVVATMFAPITFPPASVMVFRERPDGAQDLVATGSLLSVDPKRIVTKRVVLSGHPFKINRKTAVVRYMFFNRDDVLWFKPVELRTKWGRRGHIKEPLGK
nr:pre-rRNA-processing protein TSR1 homolog isoform X3 [Cherax quadricarinatus]